jgi:hypothetical protein
VLTSGGTLALDGDLQPEGALTATINGYGEVIDALTQSSQMREGDAPLAKIALGLLAKPGPDGISRVTAPLTLQNGQTFLGPAPLGAAAAFHLGVRLGA